MIIREKGRPIAAGRWLEQAELRESTTYHVGFLAVDRVRDAQLDDDAAVLLRAAEEGFVELTQVRVGEGVCAYLATRTREILG